MSAHSGGLPGAIPAPGSPSHSLIAGICASHGKPVGFPKFMRYGVPVTAGQLAVSALCVLGLFCLMGRFQ